MNMMKGPTIAKRLQQTYIHKHEGVDKSKIFITNIHEHDDNSKKYNKHTYMNMMKGPTIAKCLHKYTYINMKGLTKAN